MESNVKVASMKDVSRLVCKKFGHSISCILSTWICTKCGATLAEIRGNI